MKATAPAQNANPSSFPVDGTTAADHLDVLIIGAGISGIGIAYHIQKKLPGTSYAILEGRDAIGGTWDLFRYPGIRSDSDLPTFAYEFKPWTGEKALADGDEIAAYVRETAAENGIDQRIRFGHKVRSASYSTQSGHWTVSVDSPDGPKFLTCTWLFGASGYYDYEQGFTPEFEGRERFTDAGGQIIHPQQWPDELDYSGKKVVVIGSGATAVTLIPAMAKDAGHVTMLQRSPSYVMAIPGTDPIANALRKLFGNSVAHRIARRKNIWLQTATYRFARRRPALVRRAIRAIQKRQLPAGFDIDRHFKPSYDPWDQRPCMVPNGDMFAAIKDGSASVVTDRIKSFTETGIALESGAELEADIIITATGLNLLAFGGIELAVDGEAVDISERVAHRGTMLSGVPNFAFAFGYTNASWTLKVDLVGEYFTRLLSHMDRGGYAECTPEPDANLETGPLLDIESGYVKRGIASFPMQGETGPWRVTMDYRQDVPIYREEPINDGSLRFRTLAPSPTERELELVA